MSENTPLNSVNVINVSTPLLINRKRISVYQALFLCAGYQARYIVAFIPNLPGWAT